ncbi:MAG: hypothetical protein ACP5O3_02430 [Candidatus Micrarchaeia archaeon]|jgi:hypothetical protein
MALLPFLKTRPSKEKQEQRKTSEAENSCASEKEALASTTIRAAVYKKIIERYAEQINRGEEKTIPELKDLVKPSNAVIQATKAKIIEKLGLSEPYSAEKHFLAAVEAALSFCRSLKPVHADLPVSYWLSPEEIIELGAADPFDRAIFLASLLIALGGADARVRVVELEGGIKHPIVVFSKNSEKCLCDPCQDDSALARCGDFDKILASYSFEGKKYARSLFEFNDCEYTEFE